MQRLVVDIEDRYTNLVVDLLSNLKENVVKNITIENTSNKESSRLELYRSLITKSNNKTRLTMETALNTDDMVNDGIF
jgi:hypothetical protein